MNKDRKRRIFARKTPEVTREERAHEKLARSLAGECMVLLKNERETLPLECPGRIALYGNGARRTVKGGTGSGDVYSRRIVNVEEGLKAAGFEIGSCGWLDRYDQKWEETSKAYQEWVVSEAERKQLPPINIELDHPMGGVPPVEITEQDVADSNTDTAVYVLARNSGEGSDRFCKEGDYLLFEEEKKCLAFLGAHYSRVIVVLNIGGILDVPSIDRILGIGAVLLMGQLGNIGGNVLSDVLLGTVSPSGKLTDTWAEDYYDYPSSRNFSHNNGDTSDEYYTDGIYVGYRYFDSFGVKPWYPFGFGLSYTDFSITVKDISVKGENVSVQAAVKNTGKSYSGKEVVQVYVCPPKGRLDKAFQELKAFEKTRELVPGEAQELSLTIPLKELASYDEKAAAWILEPGEYVIRVGNSSADTRAAAALLIREEIRTEILRNLLPADGEWEEIHPAVKAGEKRNTEPHLTVIPVNASEIPSKTVNDPPARKTEQREAETQYRLEDIIHGRCTPEQVAEQLTVEELAALCVGTTRMENGSSIVGGASASVPGAAGDTSPVAEERYGIRSLVLADGPAGLRLLPHFKTDKEGKVLPGGVVFGGLVTPFETDGVEEVQDYYQYCTAIPTGWALAQSWNRELAECAGKMIGEEMEQFGVDLWLAPALNIHRNPLCGRNFEYFSEDPLISGEMAAALTKGVQSCPGKGVTIKHFAANNQEDNRYFLNAHIHERALREIYLKGFEIAVKKAKPFALMTSYNLINGIHTANSYDLLWGILRQEWGFDGLVMTDWFTSQDVPAMTGKFEQKYPISSSVGCIYAGNSVQMPGCEENVRDIVTAARTRANIDGFRITHEDLIRCAADVIRTVARCTVPDKEK